MCDPENTDLHDQQRASVRPWVRFAQLVDQKRITGHIALNGRAPAASTTMSAQWEVAGSSPAVSAIRQLKNLTLSSAPTGGVQVHQYSTLDDDA